MRMMENSHQQLPAVAAYRIVNEHTANAMVESLAPEKGGTDDDDDDTELMGDGELTSRLSLCRSNSSAIAGAPHGRIEHDKRLRREIANSNERRRMQSINAGFQSLKALLPRRDGEKMSKASILQQTSDFIRSLQSERDMLLQQNSDIKQLLDVGVSKSNRQMVEKVLTPSCVAKTEALPLEKRHYGDYGMAPMDTLTAPPKKRRKFENDSADEGLGMLSDAEAITVPRKSPDHYGVPNAPISTAAIFTQTDPPRVTIDVSCCTSPVPRTANSVENSIVQDKLWEIEMLQRQLIELRLALDRERRVRLMLEDQMRITELNRLQTLARLQTVPLVEYGLSQAPPNSAAAYPTAGSSPATAMRPATPSSLRPVSTTSTNNSATANQSALVTTMATPPLIAAVPTTTSLHSLPDPVPTRIVPIVPQPLKPNAGDLLLLPPNPGEIPSSTSPQTQPVINTASLCHSNSSKQSLAAIVEAIRHLEGDQLFVDVELQRPTAQQQSMTVVVASTGGPAVATSHCQAAMIGAAVRPDYTDSGISSPVSERHVFNAAGQNFGAPSGQNLGQIVVPTSTESNSGAELNHVVAATAAALHNLCFPYTNPRQLSVLPAAEHPSFQQQVRQLPASWTSASMR